MSAAHCLYLRFDEYDSLRSAKSEMRGPAVGRYAHFLALFWFSSARSLSTRHLKTFAGTPATIAFLGTSFVTVLPAPTIAFSPIVTRERIVAPEPIEAPFLTTVSSTFQSASVCNWPSALVARG